MTRVTRVTRVIRVLWCCKMAIASMIVSVVLFSAVGYAAGSDYKCPETSPKTSSNFEAAFTSDPGVIQCLYKDGTKLTMRPYVPDVKAVGHWSSKSTKSNICGSSTITIQSSDCPFILSHSDD